MASPTASDILVETLLDCGVDTIFGMGLSQRAWPSRSRNCCPSR
ncbi:hypothetical protein [Bradyrhizobium sp. BWA-3-5]|nr:hypothetical protein [Bradyrhizobium sp. BWA-3-5]WOH70089.1 hypothetical protein RX331_04380 [Bradyrhizobium sp. BWA-3-5]